MTTKIATDTSSVYSNGVKMPRDLCANPRQSDLLQKSENKTNWVLFPGLRVAFIRRLLRRTARTSQRPKLFPNLWHVICLRVLLHGFLENVPLSVP